MTVIDDVKQKTDIIEVIGQYTTLTKAGRNFKALCPFHTEKNPSFFVYPEQQSWHCFGACNTGGDAFSFIMKKENLDFGEALRLLAEKAGITIPDRFEQDTRKDEKERLYQVNQAAATYFHDLLLNSPFAEKARGYLSNRGLSEKTITDFQLGFSLNGWEALKQNLLEIGYAESELLEAGLLVESEDGTTHDRFRNRLIFPINDARGRVTGFGARVLDDSLPKYVNSPQTPLFDKSGTLYAIHLAAPAIRQQNLVIIVEGYMDVITAHQNGFNNVIASMGTAITEKQVNTIKRLTKSIALALDADAAGEEAMLRCIDYENILNDEIKVIVLPPGSDPDSVIRENTQTWQELVNNALPVTDYTIDITSSRLDLATAKGKSLAANQLLGIIARIKDDIRRDHYLTRLSKLTQIRYNILEAGLKDLVKQQKVKKPKARPATPSLQTLLANPREEYCLTLLLQHPELKNSSENPLPEYFQNSENREIFIAWQQNTDLSYLKEHLDRAIWEKLDSLADRELPANQIEERFADCVLRLREDYLRSLEIKRAAIFSLEAEAGGSAAELAKLEEQGIDISTQLGQIFTRRGRATRSTRDGHKEI